jgi:hypothetical protein
LVSDPSIRHRSRRVRCQPKGVACAREATFTSFGVSASAGLWNSRIDDCPHHSSTAAGPR